MPTLTPYGFWSLITWTDPAVIGALAAGFAAIAAIGILASRRSPPEEEDAQTEAPEPTEPSNPPSSEQEPSTAPEPPEVSPAELAQGKGRTVAEMVADEEIDDTELISRFVIDTEGNQLGETLTVTEGEVVLKREDGFYAVPPDAILEKSGTLLADGNIDWDEAKDAGERWEEENLDRMEYNEEGMPVSS